MSEADKHPIQEPARAQSLEEAAEQLRIAYIRIAQLWDQAWWLSLPFWRRWIYIAKGFRAPIRVSMFRERSEFYND